MTENKLVDYLKLVTAELHETRERLKEVEGAAVEPIAIVAMGCRLPGGVSSPEELWQLVTEGKDAVTGFPTDRGWDLDALHDPDPDHPGTCYVRSGGFVDAAGFDAEFFGISPREALAMDPQQRLLLETAWEVLERTGASPDTWRGSRTGVFVGTGMQDYTAGLRTPPEEVEGFLATGNAMSVASGRISYVLGLEGPAVTVDTACSSSLVALHLACQALRRGECDLALAGGATVISSPLMFIEFSRQRGLAPDGRCKPFAAAADGTGWGEGVGLVALERLSDARRNGRRVLAVVRGSAVNQDGASNGLTAPNGPAQQRVIRQALADARLSAAQVHAVEAHGTGTTLGDPVEAQALLATYGQDRSADQPLWLGSLKSNLGHTQAAAGVAGVIKTVLAMRYGTLPRTLHVDEPTPHVDWSSGAVRLVTEARPWPEDGQPRRAGVSSFGISGTNAHVVLEHDPQLDPQLDPRLEPQLDPQLDPRLEPQLDPQAAPAPDVASGTGADGSCTGADGRALPWVLSARATEALRDQADRLRTHVEAAPRLRPADVGLSLADTRSVFEHRAVAIGTDGGQLGQALATLTGADLRLPAGEVTVGGTTALGAAVTGRADTGGRAVFVFPGQGAQWGGMATSLLASSPVFAARLRECAEVLDGLTGWSLLAVLEGDPQAPSLERVDVVQPALFAVMVALAETWRSYGVQPAAVVGHSQGEIAAACVAGALSLQDAARVVVARSRVLRALSGTGGMVAVEAPAAAVREWLGSAGPGLAVAAVNGPGSTVVSGDSAALDAFVAERERAGVQVRRIAVDYGSHAPQVEAVEAELAQALAGIRPVPGRIPVFSTVDGRLVDGGGMDAAYWYRNLRQTVRFAPAIAELARQGHGAFIEVSPHPVLTSAMDETLHADGPGERPTVVAGTLRRHHGGLDRFLRSLAEVWVRGVPVDWAASFADTDARRVELPTYAFQHRRYWLDAAAASGDPTAAGLGAAGHPLLGALVTVPEDDCLLLTGRLSAHTQPWLTEHRVNGPLLPGTAFVELALHAGATAGCDRVEELTLENPLPLPEDGALQLVVRLDAPDGAGRRAVAVHSRPEGAALDEPWLRHAHGVLAPDPSGSAPASDGDPTAWPPAGAVPVDVGDVYDRFLTAGLDYGPLFRGLRAAWEHGGELYAEVALPEDAHAEARRYGLHPALFDAALHTLLLTAPGDDPGSTGHLPFHWEGVTLSAVGATALRVRLSGGLGRGPVALRLADGAGHPVASVESLTVRPLPGRLAPPTGPAHRDALFRLDWPALDAAPADGAWTVLTDGDEPAGHPAPGGHTVDTHPDLAALDTALAAGRPVPDAVLVRCDGRYASDTHEATARALGLLQGWLAGTRWDAARLVFVTRGAVRVAPGERPADPVQAAVWGLVRSAQSEHPGRFVLVDRDGDGPVAPADGIRAALSSGEPQCAVRAGVVHAARLARPGADALLPPTGEPAWRLDAGAGGTVESLALVPAPEALRPLAPGEVRVAVRAAGLNFRDVLVALGMYPGGGTLGSEGAGVVVETAPDVTGFAPGDRVFGMLAHAFGPTAVTDHRTLARMPEGWTFAEAAAVPVVHLTAYYALVDLAGLRPGESVLIHAAAGGVGLAAVQLARYLGAEVYGTASPAKWDALRTAGLAENRIASSRSLDFEERLRAATGGRGVDVVLNSLAGEFVDASLRLVADGGRFIEMGKTDIRENVPTGLRYRAFDLVEAGPERIREMLGEILRLFTAGALRPLPLTVRDVREAPEAFRQLSRAGHTGKLVLTVPAPLDPDGTVLITGGTGALGALLARHLVTAHGVRHLLLAGRRGPAAEGAAQLADELSALGARVAVAACDLTDSEAVTGLLDAVPADRPLTAVVHAAGVLDDGTVEALTPQRLGAVLRPKADAARLLHDATAGLDLAAFITFSSAAGVFGAPGQGNYAAANAFLDGLAQHRRARGLPALSLAWGLWERSSGMTGHLTEADLRRMARGGLKPLTAEQGLELFDAALAAQHHAVLVPVPLDLAALRERDRAGGLPTVLRGLVAAPTRRRLAGNGPDIGTADAGEELRRRVGALPPADREAALLDLVRGHVAAVLGHADAGAVVPDRAFREVGFDSLTAVELRNRLNGSTGRRLPATLVFDFPTPRALARHLLETVFLEDGDTGDPLHRELDRLEELLTSRRPDEADRDGITARLQTLLWRWKDRGTAAQAEVSPAARHVPDDLTSASDDEMFALIDREIGRP
ncbi:SDR family NAD(P)-dependent oxidoreductase [Kitasatospora sp. NPDC018058]|uniref:SDR family NAD(P)-dependent oxidoreductase n=1 Tax=Kitasatospora sp. NPDC018058 TaxID=3364025 RepID=UPI0037C1AAAC